MKIMTMVCIGNDSKKSELVIGKTYEVYEHNNPNTFWVRIESSLVKFPFTSMNYRTIQCYKSDFVTQSENRDTKINEILK